MMRRLSLGTLVLAVACAAPAPSPPAAAPAPEPLPPFPHAAVWTAAPDVPLLVGDVVHSLPGALTRLEVLGRDSLGLDVRCEVCPGAPRGRVDPERVIHTAGNPAGAVHGDLAGFALAIRAAALRHDVDALREVMSPTFTFSFGEWGGPVEALAAWEREGYRALDHLPGLLDRGIRSRDGRIWAAPPEYLVEDEFLGYRAGFSREGGRWVWMFLVRGD
jgi:hypothetical protein